LAFGANVTVSVAVPFTSSDIGTVLVSNE